MVDLKKDSGILLKSGTNEVEFLEFGIAEQTYGINVSKIRQVLVFEPEKVVVLPGAPECVLGSFCFRGAPVPVIDFASYFKLPKRSEQLRRLLLVTEFNQFVLAFVVDSVKNIRRCSWEDFHPSSHGAFGGSESSIVGTIIENGNMMPILDVEAILGELVPSASISSQAEIAHGKPSLDRASAKLVYCEDSKLVQKVFLKSLQENGFGNIKLFATGLEGLNYLKSAGENEVDIIISDIEMPQMDGLTLCREIKQNTKFSNVPFLFFSSTVSDEMRRKCESVGGSAAYSKPEIGDLIKELDSRIGQKK